jgi:hypothetical protein
MARSRVASLVCQHDVRQAMLETGQAMAESQAVTQLGEPLYDVSCCTTRNILVGRVRRSSSHRRRSIVHRPLTCRRD